MLVDRYSRVRVNGPISELATLFLYRLSSWGNACFRFCALKLLRRTQRYPLLSQRSLLHASGEQQWTVAQSRDYLSDIDCCQLSITRHYNVVNGRCSHSARRRSVTDVEQHFIPISYNISVSIMIRIFGIGRVCGRQQPPDDWFFVYPTGKACPVKFQRCFGGVDVAYFSHPYGKRAIRDCVPVKNRRYRPSGAMS